MSIRNKLEHGGMSRVGEAVAVVLREMTSYARPGLSTFELDQFGAKLLKKYGARSAPKLTYGFPGHTCISINQEIAHGIPSREKILKEGDLINIDVSAELNGFWADNGGSFVLGDDPHSHTPLVLASMHLLQKALRQIRHGTPVSDIGQCIENGARKIGFRVIRNLAGHGVGRSLHESPAEILNCYDPDNRDVFKRNDVVAMETFISTRSFLARTSSDGWTLIGNRGGYCAQHEHTLRVTDEEPEVFTAANGYAN